MSSFPTLYVLDAQGVIRYVGPRNEKLDQAVDALLSELETTRQGARAIEAAQGGKVGKKE